MKQISRHALHNLYNELNALSPISNEDLINASMVLNGIWNIWFKQKSYGPFSTQTIINILAKITDFPSEISIKKHSDIIWHPIYTINEFKQYNLKNKCKLTFCLEDNILLFKDGLRVGPIKYIDILEELQNKKLTIKMIISSDDGKSWIKIAHHPFFYLFNYKITDNEKLSLPDIPDTIPQRVLNTVYETRVEKASSKLNQLILFTITILLFLFIGNYYFFSKIKDEITLKKVNSSTKILPKFIKAKAKAKAKKTKEISTDNSFPASPQDSQIINVKPIHTNPLLDTSKMVFPGTYEYEQEMNENRRIKEGEDLQNKYNMQTQY